MACLLPAPMDGVPYPQPLAGPEPQYMPWRLLLVRPIGHPPGRCHRGPLTNGPGRIPPYCVCSGGADTVTGGAPKPLRLGPLPAFHGAPYFGPAPPFAVWFVVVGFPSLRGGMVVVGGQLFAFPGRVACARVPASPGCGSPPVAAVGPPPLLAVGLGLRCGSPPLLAGVLWCWWGVGLRHSWLRSAGLRGVVPRFRLWVLGGRSVATPG